MRNILNNIILTSQKMAYQQSAGARLRIVRRQHDYASLAPVRGATRVGPLGRCVHP